MKDKRRDLIPPNNLPNPLSTFIGRDQEIGRVRQLLADHRLVMLTGAGGNGKTRLSLKVAGELLDQFKNGIWFVELASIFDPVLIPQTIASVLELREPSGQTYTEVLIDHLASRRMLLLLDNCEHLVAGVARLTETLLQSCPELKILGTSREVLGITGEAAFTVPPLTLPDQQPWKDPGSALESLKLYQSCESVQLFVARARTFSFDFELTPENGPWVAEICRHLDGMPLAIELAAARLRSLSVQQIAQRLNDRFHLLTSGSRTAPLRQQTLEATLDWSYDLLTETEQIVLLRISVFAGGAALAATERVCAGEGVEADGVLDALSHLVEKSLVMADKSGRGEMRYRLLETIRQYALTKLVETGHADEVKNFHLNYYLRWAEEAELHLNGVDQLSWLEQYEADHDNLRAALEWCRVAGDRADLGLRLAVACGLFWRLRGYLSEGRAHISAALSSSGPPQDSEPYAQALYWGASLAYLQSDYPATRSLGLESLTIWNKLKPRHKSGLAATFDLLGELATEEGDYENAPMLLQQALEIYRELQDENGIADMHMQLGWAYMRMGKYDQVSAHMEEALAIYRKTGNVLRMGFILGGLGELDIRQGQYERAVRLLEESLAVRQEHGHKWGMGTSLGSLGWVALRQRDYSRMKTLLGESLSIRMEISDRGGIAWCLEKLAEGKYEQSLMDEAAKIFGHAQALRAPIGSVIDPADQEEYDRLITGLRSSLGEKAFTALWGEGASMPLDQIVDLALSGSESATGAARAEKDKYGGLTRREREVAALIAKGKSNREIAESMTVGVKTIETYVTRILHKLNFDSRVQVATWAVEKGLI